jgi:hypothetical protein
MDGLRSAIGIGGAKGAGSHTGLNLLPTTKLVTLQTILTFVREGLRKHGLSMAGGRLSRRRGDDVPLNKTPFPKGLFHAYESQHARTTRHPLEVGYVGVKGKSSTQVAIETSTEEYLGGDIVNDWYVADVDWAEGNQDMSAWDVARLDVNGLESGVDNVDVGAALAVGAFAFFVLTPRPTISPSC